MLKRVFVTKKEPQREAVDDIDAQGAVAMLGVQSKKGVPAIVKQAIGG